MRVIWGDAEAEYFCEGGLDGTYRIEERTRFSFLAQGLRLSFRDGPKDQTRNREILRRAIAP